jgi:hypothetical protein
MRKNAQKLENLGITMLILVLIFEFGSMQLGFLKIIY